MDAIDSLTAVATPSPSDRPAEGHDPAIRKAAVAFETVFLTEMLKHTGLGKTPELFGGGAGESAFSGMMVEAYARRIADAGTTGVGARIADELAARARR